MRGKGRRGRKVLPPGEPPGEEPRGVVAELAGVLKGLEIGDEREEYSEYLLKKYGISSVRQE